MALLAAPEGLRLAPFYDLLCTRVYSGLAKHFAFRIGGESLPGALEPRHLNALALWPVGFRWSRALVACQNVMIVA